MSLHRWRFAGPSRGRKPFLARAVIAGPIIFLFHNQSTPSPSHTTLNVNALSVPSVGPPRRRTKRLNSGPELRFFQNHCTTAVVPLEALHNFTRTTVQQSLLVRSRTLTTTRKRPHVFVTPVSILE